MAALWPPGHRIVCVFSERAAAGGLVEVASADGGLVEVASADGFSVVHTDSKRRIY